MVSFLALYRGSSLSAAELVALSTDPLLVRRFASELLDSERERESPNDPLLKAVKLGKRQALALIAEDPSDPEEGCRSSPHPATEVADDG